ncbi:MAG: outer membrane protein assembly factor BamB [Betaproteobacteria bacterium]|nr:outer membrane protein assembly factor BamB [Betaproteobacteria bacterium]
MRAFPSTLLVLGLALSLSGCSWFGDWFGPSTPVVKPAPLPDFKAVVSLERAWDARVGEAGAYEFSPGTDGQAIYAAGRDGRIVKLDIASGREIWRIDAGRALSSGVGVGEGLVLVGTPKGELLAFKSADGARAWTAMLSGELLTPAEAVNGLVAARTNDGRIDLLEAATGKARWSTTRSLPTLILREQSHLLLGVNAVYAGHAGGRLSALTLNNGAPQWEANVALPRGATELERIADVTGTLAMDDRRVCAAAYQGRVACFDRANGNTLWARDTSSTGGVDLDERQLYVVDASDSVAAFDKNRGNNPWKQDKLRDRKLSSPVAVGDKYVAVGDYQGYVHLIQADDGAFAARAATDGSLIKGIMLPLKSGLVVQTANGGVYALRIGQ